MGEFYIPKRGAGGGSSTSSPSSPASSPYPSTSKSPEAPRTGSFYIPRRTPPTTTPEEDDSSSFVSDIFSSAGDYISKGWEATRPVRDTLGNILDVTQAGMGAATTLASELQNYNPEKIGDVFESYRNIAAENVDQIQAEKAARGEAPELGVTDYIRAAPKVGQLMFAGAKPESQGGQAIKRLGELGVNIVSDPASYSPAGIRNLSGALKEAPGLVGKVKAGAEAAFGTPLAGAIFAPDLVEGAIQGGKGAYESLQKGEYLDAAGQAAEALGLGGLGVLMGKGIVNEVGGLRKAPEAPRPQAAPFDEEFVPQPTSPEAPVVAGPEPTRAQRMEAFEQELLARKPLVDAGIMTEDQLRQQLALEMTDDRFQARQAAGGVEPDVFVRDFDEELAGQGEVPLGAGPLRGPVDTLPPVPLDTSTLPAVPPPDVFGRVVGPETPLTVPPPEPGRAEVPLQEETPPATRVPPTDNPYAPSPEAPYGRGSDGRPLPPPMAPPPVRRGGGGQANDLGAALYEGGRSLGPYIAEGLEVFRRVGAKATDFLREMQPRIPDASMGQLLQLHQKIRSELGQAREEVRGRAAEGDPFGEIMAPQAPPRLRRVSTPEEARRAYAERPPDAPDPLVEPGSRVAQSREWWREGRRLPPETRGRFATPEAEYAAYREGQEFNEDAFKGPDYEELPQVRKDPGRPLTRPEIEGMIPADFRSNRGDLRGAVAGEARSLGIPQDSEAGHFQREVLSTGHLSIENAKKEASLNVPEAERKYSGYQDLGGGVEMVRRTGGYEGQDTVFFVKKNPKGETLAAAVIKNGKMTDLASYKIGSSAAARLMQGVLKSGVPFKSSDLISPDTRRLLAGAIERAQVPWSEVARWVSSGLDSIPFTEVLAKGKGVESVFAGSARKGAGGEAGGAGGGVLRDVPRGSLAPAPRGVGGGLREAPGRAVEGAPGTRSAPDAGRGGSREAAGDAGDAPKPGEGAGRGAFGRPAVATAGLDPSEGIRAVKEVAGALRKEKPEAEGKGKVEEKAKAEAKPEPPKEEPATPKTFRDPVTGRIYSYSPRGDKGKVPEISPETATMLGRAGRDITSLPAKGKPSPKDDSPEADINVPRISTDPAVEQFVGKMVREGGSSLFGRGPKGARGPRRGWAEVRAKAVALGLDPAQVKQAFQKKGGFLSDVEMESASILQHEIYNRAETKFQEVGRLRKEGKGEQADTQQDLYDQEIANLASVTYAMIGARAEAARVLSLARKLGQGLTPEERNAWKLLQKTSRIMGKDVPNSPEFRDEMFKAIKEKNSARVGELTRKAYNKKWLDKYAEYWTSGLLSGPPTHVVNFVSNALEATVAQPAIRVIEGALDRYMNIKTGDSKRVREKYSGEALAMYKGALLAQDAALWGPKGLFSEIKDIFTLKYEDKQIARALEGDVAAMDFLEFGRAIQGKKGEAIRIPLNLLQAADQYWKTVARAQNLHATAYRLGKQQGLKGKALANFSGEWLKNYSPETFPEIESSIVKAEKDATFQSQLGPFGRGLQQLATKHPMLRLMGMTFIRTPTNLLKKSILRSPLGFLLPYWKGDMTQAEKHRAYAEAAFGSAVMGAVWGAINAEGGIEVTGSGPADYNEKETLKQSGWQENSFRHPTLTGGKWVSYKRLDPISSMVGWVADLKETSDLNRWSDRWEKITASLGENVFDKSFWAGALQTMEAITNPSRHGERWVKTQLGSHVPMTGLLGRIAQSIDPTVRQSDAYETIDVEGVPVPEAVATKIPGLSKKLPAKRDVVGEEAQRRQEGPWGTFINPFAISEDLVGQVPDLKREMVKVHGVPDQPERYITFRDRRGKQHRVDLTDREYSLVQNEYKEAATRASRLIRSSFYKALPDDADKKEEILKIYRQARRKGRDRLYLDPDFRKREAQLRKEVATKKAKAIPGGGGGSS